LLPRVPVHRRVGRSVCEPALGAFLLAVLMNTTAIVYLSTFFCSLFRILVYIEEKSLQLFLKK
jgi:hypothetical protein